MDDDQVLIEPRRIIGDPKIDHPVILVLFGPYLDLIRKQMKVKKAAVKRMRFPSMSYFSKKMDGKNVLVCGTPLGAPQAALALERLIAMGAREVLAFGCCGSLRTDLPVGHVVIPTEAWSEEGTSAHYPLPAGVVPRADEEITRLCVALCREEERPSACGKVWTTDALFRETRGKVKRYAKRGALAVEMEWAALLTVAAYRGIRLGGLMVVSDELGTLTWKTGFLSPFFWRASMKAARLAVVAGRRL